MTDKEFRTLCDETETGTILSLVMGDEQARGRFVGCSEDGVMLESDGRVSIWPPDLIDYRKTEYPKPSYS